jgi:hypothetical protein
MELCWPSDHRLSENVVQTFADRGCCLVSAMYPYGHIMVMCLTQWFSNTDRPLEIIQKYTCIPLSNSAAQYTLLEVPIRLYSDGESLNSFAASPHLEWRWKGSTFLCAQLFKHHATSEVIAPLFLTFALEACEWSASHPSCFTPGTHWIEGWVCPISELAWMHWSREKWISPDRNWAPAVHPVASLYTNWWILTSTVAVSYKILLCSHITVGCDQQFEKLASTSVA